MIKCRINIYLSCALLWLSIVGGQIQAYSQQGKKEWLKLLYNEIQISGNYDARKIKKIDSIRRLTNKVPNPELLKRYVALSEEYSVFIFDSAYHYTKKMQQAALSFNDSTLQIKAILRLNAVLLSSGMFKEVFESWDRFNTTGLNNKVKLEFYLLKARGLFDLADYNSGSIFSKAYNQQAEVYIDSALALSPPTSFEYLYYNGLKSIRAGNIRGATNYFGELLLDSTLSLRQQAVVYSTFSDIYIRRGLVDSAIILLAKAAIADIKSCTKETTAIFNLATLLFKQKDVDNASLFIQKAAYDAKVYGARHRQVQLSNILPIIEAERIAQAERKRNNITQYATFITVLVGFLLILSFVIYRQVKTLKKQQKEINRTNVSLHHLVEEKEWLLKEVHHRVKNNLHTINSLLESQSAYLEKDALTAIKNSQRRVFAMSIIHQKLYQPEKNETKIDMSLYLYELVNYLRESFEDAKRIEFKMDLQSVALDISIAVPLGLILNEAITNSLKYAFTEQTSGIITITVAKKEEDTFLFIVADNGIGIGETASVKKGSSLGMELMKGLADEIGGTFSVEQKEGTMIIVEFTTTRQPKQDV